MYIILLIIGGGGGGGGGGMPINWDVNKILF